MTSFLGLILYLIVGRILVAYLVKSGNLLIQGGRRLRIATVWFWPLVLAVVTKDALVSAWMVAARKQQNRR